MKILVCLLVLIPILAFAVDLPNRPIRFSHALPVMSLLHVGVFTPFEKHVAESGKLKVDIFPGGTLGKNNVQVELVEQGLVDMAFIIPDSNGMKDVHLDKVMVLWKGQFNPWVVYSTKPIESLKGKKVGYSNTDVMRYIKKEGGVPVFSMPMDMYMNLKNGVTDAEIALIESLETFKLDEVAKYIYIVDFGRGDNYVLFNLANWNKLSKEEQKILLVNAKKAEEIQIEVYKKSWTRCISVAMKKGIEVKEY